MITEGSFETEDCSNDAEIQLTITGINYILKYSNRKQFFQIVIIFHNISFFFLLYYYLINALSIRDFFQKHCLTSPKLVNGQVYNMY